MKCDDVIELVCTVAYVLGRFPRRVVHTGREVRAKASEVSAERSRLGYTRQLGSSVSVRHSSWTSKRDW